MADGSAIFRRAQTKDKHSQREEDEKDLKVLAVDFRDGQNDVIECVFHDLSP